MRMEDKGARTDY